MREKIKFPSGEDWIVEELREGRISRTSREASGSSLPDPPRTRLGGVSVKSTSRSRRPSDPKIPTNGFATAVPSGPGLEYEPETSTFPSDAAAICAGSSSGGRLNLGFNSTMSCAAQCATIRNAGTHTRANLWTFMRPSPCSECGRSRRPQLRAHRSYPRVKGPNDHQAPGTPVRAFESHESPNRTLGG